LPLVALAVLAACKDPGVQSSPTADTANVPRRSSDPGSARAKDDSHSMGNKVAIAPAALDPAKATEKAPDTFKARFTTTKGPFVIEVHREWAPGGADRFYNLVKIGYFNDTRFFRAVEGFMVQFGLHGLPEVNTAWRAAKIPDDKPTQSNKRGFVSFAMAGPGSRTTQVFINYSDSNARLDGMGFAPFGQVTQGMEIVDSLYKGYGEGAPGGRGPNQGRIQSEGNVYLDRDFPELDRVKVAEIVP
jgi:peptidyl-prolyl cis-trans isomerase A (cyclophilin A)